MLRVLIGGFALAELRRRAALLRGVARTDPALFAPVGPVRAAPRPIAPETFERLVTVTQAAGLAYLLGWRYRWSGPGFAGLHLWVLSYRNSWSMVFHNDNVLVLHVLVLGLSPAADALSLDATARTRGRRSPLRGAEYGWPVRLMNAVSLLTYFLAGVSKLKGPLGRRWATGQALRSQVAVDTVRKEVLGGSPAPLAFKLYHRLGLFRMLAMGSLLLELAAPLVMLDRRLARAWAVNAFLMHWGIYAVMRIKFRYQLAGVMYAPFFDLDRLLGLLRR